jgi:hypothetical protein
MKGEKPPPRINERPPEYGVNERLAMAYLPFASLRDSALETHRKASCSAFWRTQKGAWLDKRWAQIEPLLMKGERFVKVH